MKSREAFQRGRCVGAGAAHARAGGDALVDMDCGGKVLFHRFFQRSVSFEDRVVSRVWDREAGDGQGGLVCGRQCDEVVEVDRLQRRADVVKAVVPPAQADEPASGFLTVAGTPAARWPGGICCPSCRTAPAASIEPAPSRLRWSIVAPIPTSAPCSTMQPSSRAEWPMVTLLSIRVGRLVAQWMTTLSWTFEPSPTLIWASSARRTAPNHTLAPAPTSTF